ncbi:RluA family pseudouridine synthase [Candidatus Uhrbacteria bacterium]|nr:RluA family pseudouridine synthase [Candidatus Uhrbacteria bacterium]
MIIFQVSDKEQNERLDIFLAKKLNRSRASVQKLIKSESVLVEKKPAESDLRLQTGQKIEVPELEESAPKIKKGEIPILDIIYEDNDLLVINKPAGLLVHEAEGKENEPTVVDALLERYPSITEIGEDPKRPGIVHRLDKDVSGLMVITKTQQAFESLKTQFQNRKIHKEYLALVYGTLPKDHDVIQFKIARSHARGRMVARTETQEGKEAITEYEVLKRFKNHTYARVILHTGRTHQIRVHFLAIDHPLVGDNLYQKNHMKNIRQIELDRIFLHSHKLRLKLIDGTEKTFEEPLPHKLENLLRTLPI